MMQRRYRTVLVHDPSEDPALLTGIVNTDPEIDLIETFYRADDAIKHLTRHQADILIQRSQMADSDGFSLYQTVGREAVSSVIFYSENAVHAARAFDVEAADFITLPADEGRIQHALLRAKKQAARQREGELKDELLKLIGTAPAARYAARIPVRLADRVYFVQTSDVEYVEADGNYVALVTDGKRHLIRETMSNLSEKLDPERFVRIHRSAIVNLDCIRELQPWFHGDYMVLLKSGKKLTMSRNFRRNMQAFLEQ